MTVTSMSKAEFVAKYAWLNPIHNALARSKSKSGTWGERNSRQRIANEKAKSQGFYLAWREQIAIETNPINIARWANEERLIEEEEERLLQIELENQRKQNEIKRKETTRLLEIENQRLLEIENQKIIPAVVATSSLIPLAVIGLLLYTSRGKK